MLEFNNNFWNNKRIVKVFRDDSPSRYLIKYFNKIKNPSNKKVLDVGCGGGRNTEMLTGFGFIVYGCDLNKMMVECTRKRIRKKNNLDKNIIIAPMSKLPYPKNYFDFVVSNGVLHNAKKPEEFKVSIVEMSRVLKRGGYLILNTFIKGCIREEFKKDKNIDHLFYTKKGVPIILLSKNKLINLTLENNLNLESFLIKYTTIETGKRRVFKGIFQKN